ncbi:hypothetical protein BH09SUM1_BH09SUM1_21630 [soil metagenome]
MIIRPRLWLPVLQTLTFLLAALAVPHFAAAQGDPFASTGDPFAEAPAGATDQAAPTLPPPPPPPPEDQAAPAGTPAPAVEDLSQQQDLNRKVKIQEMQERIRILNAQQKYEDVIHEADELLKTDSLNATAILYKNLAEKSIAETTARPGTDPNDLTNRTPPPITPVATPEEVKYTPAPLQPRRVYGQNVFLRNWKYLALGAGVAVGLGIIVFAVIWFINRKSGKSAKAAPTALPQRQAMSMGLGLNRNRPFADQPTGGRAPDSLFDAPTNPDGIAKDFKTGQHSDNTNVDQPQERHSTSELIPAGAVSSDVVQMEGLRMDSSPANSTDIGSSLGIDYSNTDGPMADSQADDIYQTGGSPFSGRPAEPLSTPPPQSAKSAPPAMDIVPSSPPPSRGIDIHEENTIAMSLAPSPKKPAASQPGPAATSKPSIDISAPLPPMPAAKPHNAPLPTPPSDMMAGFDIASPPAPRPDQTASQDPNAMSFNSLMFGSEQSNPSAAPPKPAPEAPLPEDMTNNSFNAQFSNVMFGSGSEDTKMPAAAKQPAPAPAPRADTPSSEKTSILGSSSIAAPKGIAAPAAKDDDIDPDKTVPLNAAAASAPGKTSMFDRQKDAGRRAMDSEDYARAVQCFSVAASLKPADKEVRELLEEARKRRKG